MNQTHPLVVAASTALIDLTTAREAAREAGARWGTWEAVDRSAIARLVAKRHPRRQAHTIAAAVDYLIDHVNSWDRDLGTFGVMEARHSDRKLLDAEFGLCRRGPLSEALAMALASVARGVDSLIRPMNITLYNQELERYERDCRANTETKRRLPGLIAALAVELPAAATLTAGLSAEGFDSTTARKALTALNELLGTVATIP